MTLFLDLRKVNIVRQLYLFFSIFLVFTLGDLCGQNSFRYEYELGVATSGYDDGGGGGGYKAADGTFYLSGTKDNMDTDTDPDPILLKINSNGTVNFVREYAITGGGNSWEYISHGKLTADGGYLLYGSTEYNNPGDILLIKTGSTGVIAWAREINITGATSVSPTKFFEKSTGGYLMTGTISGVGAGQSDVFVISISSDGNAINFAKAYGTADFQHGQSIIEHSSGKISFVGDTRVSAGNVFDGWWVELNSTGTTVNYSKSLGEGGLQSEGFNDLIETTANNYFVVGDFCGGLSHCSAYFSEFSATTGNASNKKYFTTNPTGTVFSIGNVSRTPDNNNYWMSGVIVTGGADNDCLVLKTNSGTPAPTTGYSIGDSDDQSFYYSFGAAAGNDEYVVGGTENRTPSGDAEWRPSLIKTQSALQCNSTTVNFTSSNYATATADVATTITNLTTTLYSLVVGTDIFTSTPGATAIENCLTALPVSLVSFSGKAENNSGRLSWSTASEENNNYFTLERSVDGVTFSEIGKINGAGNSNTILDYEFTDEIPLEQNYYRLSQTDFNGQREDLGIVNVKFLNDAANLSLQVQSNPVIENILSLNLFSSGDEDVILKVMDLQGRTIRLEKHLLKKDESKLISLDLSDVSAGAYFISATGINSSVNSKFLLLNRE